MIHHKTWYIWTKVTWLTLGPIPAFELEAALNEAQDDFKNVQLDEWDQEDVERREKFAKIRSEHYNMKLALQKSKQLMEEDDIN